eukprot:Ihof_evm8s97 gene=Ihof_evmTU8s97
MSEQHMKAPLSANAEKFITLLIDRLETSTFSQSKEQLGKAIGQAVHKLVTKVPFKAELVERLDEIIESSWLRIHDQRNGFDLNCEAGRVAALTKAKELEGKDVDTLYAKLLLSSPTANDMVAVIGDWEAARVATEESMGTVEHTENFIRTLQAAFSEELDVKVLVALMSAITTDMARLEPVLITANENKTMDHDSVTKLLQTVDALFMQMRVKLVGLGPHSNWSYKDQATYSKAAGQLYSVYVSLLAISMVPSQPLADKATAAAAMLIWLLGQSADSILNGTLPLLAEIVREGKSSQKKNHHATKAAITLIIYKAALASCTLQGPSLASPTTHAKLICLLRLGSHLAAQSGAQSVSIQTAEQLISKIPAPISLVSYVPDITVKLSITPDSPAFASAVRRYLIRSATLDEAIDMYQTLSTGSSGTSAFDVDQEGTNGNVSAFFIDKTSSMKEASDSNAEEEKNVESEGEPVEEKISQKDKLIENISGLIGTLDSPKATKGTKRANTELQSEPLESSG